MARSNAGRTNYQHRAWLAQSRSKTRGGSSLLPFTDLRDKGDQTGETVWLDWWQQQTTSLTLAATEAADTVAITLSAAFSFAATEGSDTASFTAEPDTTPITLGAVEGSDTAALNVNETAQLAATEAADTLAFTVTVDVQLLATEDVDTINASVNETVLLAGIEAEDTASVAVNETIQLLATEESDTASFAMSAAGAFELGATEESDTAVFWLAIPGAPSTGLGSFPQTRRRELPEPKEDLSALLALYANAIPVEVATEIQKVVTQADEVDHHLETMATLSKMLVLLQEALARTKAAKLEAIVKQYLLAAMHRLQVEMKRREQVAEDDVLLELMAAELSEPDDPHDDWR